eukprot:12907970-Ditylum_brightwellii.AAC.1
MSNVYNDDDAAGGENSFQKKTISLSKTQSVLVRDDNNDYNTRPYPNYPMSSVFIEPKILPTTKPLFDNDDNVLLNTIKDDTKMSLTVIVDGNDGNNLFAIDPSCSC